MHTRTYHLGDVVPETDLAHSRFVDSSNKYEVFIALL